MRISLLVDDDGRQLFFFDDKVNLDAYAMSEMDKARWSEKMRHDLCRVIPVMVGDETVH